MLTEDETLNLRAVVNALKNFDKIPSDKIRKALQESEDKAVIVVDINGVWRVQNLPSEPYVELKDTDFVFSVWDEELSNYTIVCINNTVYDILVRELIRLTEKSLP